MRLIEIIYSLSTTTIVYLRYKSNNKDNFKIIKDNFNVLAEFQNNIFYRITPQQMRKVKLEILNRNITLKEIIDESNITIISELFDEYSEILNDELKMSWTMIH